MAKQATSPRSFRLTRQRLVSTLTSSKHMTCSQSLNDSDSFSSPAISDAAVHSSCSSQAATPSSDTLHADDEHDSVQSRDIDYNLKHIAPHPAAKQAHPKGVLRPPVTQQYSSRYRWPRRILPALETHNYAPHADLARLDRLLSMQVYIPRLRNRRRIGYNHQRYWNSTTATDVERELLNSLMGGSAQVCWIARAYPALAEVGEHGDTEAVTPIGFAVSSHDSSDDEEDLDQ
jgi:hypothetical protein